MILFHIQFISRNLKIQLIYHVIFAEKFAHQLNHYKL